MEEFWDLTFMRRASGTSGGSHSPQQCRVTVASGTGRASCCSPSASKQGSGTGTTCPGHPVIEEEGGMLRAIERRLLNFVRLLQQIVSKHPQAVMPGAYPSERQAP
jgi:hypothetical protein